MKNLNTLIKLDNASCLKIRYIFTLSYPNLHPKYLDIGVLIMEKSTKKSTEVVRTEIVLPGDTNHFRTIFGGKTLAMMDMTGALAAMQFSNSNAVTASFESVDFEKPIMEGDIVKVIAKVIYTSRTSMVVKIDVFKYESEKFHSNKEFTCGGFATFVAIDKEGKPYPIPQLELETKEEKDLWEVGEEIKKKAKLRANK